MKKLLSILLVLLLSFGALAEHMGAPYEFRESPVTAARIAPGVTEIAEGAYYYCKELKTLEVPATVTKIGDYAFDHCENLTELTIPDSVREIGECAFNYCMRIASLDLGNGVKTLGSYAFSCCFSLRQAAIPQSVTSIGDYAFYNCRALDTLYIYSGVQSIGASALEGCPRLTVYTPAASFAAAYCTQNGIKWVAIEEPEKAEPPADLPESTNTTEDKYELSANGEKNQDYMTDTTDHSVEEIVFLTPNHEIPLPLGKEIFVSWKPVKGADGYVYSAIAHSGEWQYLDIVVPSGESFTLKKECAYKETAVDITVSAWKGIWGKHQTIATGAITVYIQDDWCGKFGHIYDSGSYSEQHPHNMVLTCTVCGHKYTTSELGRFDDCLDCVCLHDTGYIVDDHPHKYAYCTECGKKFMTRDLGIGALFSYCDECFPFEEQARKYAALAAEVYGMKPYGFGSTVNRWEISDDNRTGFKDAADPVTEALIKTSLTADGKLFVTISFEGSQDLKDDWIRDAVASAKNGIHVGLNNAMQRFINDYINNEDQQMSVSLKTQIAEIDGLYSLKQLLNQVKNTPGARLCITGHSLGGAMAQYFTYYAIEKLGISPNQIETYTYASMIPFTDEFVLSHAKLQDATIYNFIDVRDLVPDIGVTNEAELSIDLEEGKWERLWLDRELYSSLAENGQVFIDFINNGYEHLGGFNKSGCNIGKNIYLDSGDIESDVAKILKTKRGIDEILYILTNIHAVEHYQEMMENLPEYWLAEINTIDIVRRKKEIFLQKDK